MKKTYLIYFIIAFGFFTGCVKEDFLEKYPLTGVSVETFFKTDNDFKLYVNQFYTDLGAFNGWTIGLYDDELGSDNEIGAQPSLRLNGQIIKPVNDASWDNAYRNIRNVNIMLANTDDANWNEIKPYVGEGKFFRAWYYFNLLKRFGGVPWIGEPLDPNDMEELKTPRSPRNVIVDSIVADLDFAIENLPVKSKAENLRLYKEVALAFKSRVCLYEGTWEKYHGKEGTSFKVDGSDGTKYLEQAMDAALEVINSGVFFIEKSGDEPYYNLFNRENYSSNTEIMLWRQSLRELQPQNVSDLINISHRVIGLTKDLIDAYLCTDGKPVSLTSLTIADDSLTVVIQNRDPRLAQTIFYPGVSCQIDDATGEVQKVFEYPDLVYAITGYHFRKGGSAMISNNQMNQDQMAYIYFRYAEVLLNYIEAKAELFESGKATLSQSDFDISINELRDRVSMVHFDFSDVIEDPQNLFTGKIPWYLVEIRRERRVELVVEGFRIDDILRWAAADELIKGKIFRGAKYQWYIDRGWYEPDQIEYVDDQGIISPWYNTEIDLQGGYNFDLNRDYLLPIPQQEEILGGYTNNPGW